MGRCHFLAWAGDPAAHDFLDLFPAPGVIPRDNSGKGRPFPVTYHVPTEGARFRRRARVAVPVLPPWAGPRSNRLYIIYIYWTSARPARGPGPGGAWWSLGGEGGAKGGMGGRGRDAVHNDTNRLCPQKDTKT